MARTQLAGGFAAVQQVQEMRADRVIVGLHLDAPPLAASSDTSSTASNPSTPAAGPRCRARRHRSMIVRLGHAQPSAETPVRSTSIGWLAAGSCSSTVATAAGSARSALSLLFVGGQFRCDSAAFRGSARCAISSNSHCGGDVENVVAAVVQIVAGSAHRAQRGIARRDAGQATDFFGLNAPGALRFGMSSAGHFSFPSANSSSNFAS